MPFDAGGTFSRSYNWQADRDAGIKILAQRMDGEFDNYKGGMNQTFLRNGLVPMSGPLNMNGNPVVGVAAGSLLNPGIRFETDSDTGIMQTGPGNITLVADGIAVLSVTAAGVSINGGVATTAPPVFNDDATFNDTATFNSEVVFNQNLTFDVGDYLVYNKGTNVLTMVIGTNMAFAIGANAVWGPTAATDPFELGTKDATPRGLAANGALVRTDRGNTVVTQTGLTQLTVPPAVLPVGAIVGIFNSSAAAITIVQGAGVSLILANSIAAPANRTLAPNGWCTIHQVIANSWICGGAGLS